MSEQTNPIASSNGTSRRDFLARTAAVAGAAAVLGPVAASTARAAFTSAFPVPIAPTPPGPDDVIQMGVIGTGGMGTGHCEQFTKLAKDGKAKVQIVALADVCDPRVENAKSVVEKAQGNKVDTYRKYTDLLARKDIHGVLIASPEHWHSQMAIDAIMAGKDVYVEKPMTGNLEDAMKLLEASKKNPKVIVQVGTQYMQYPRYAVARKWIKDGVIGKPTFSQTSYCRNSLKGEWLYYDIDPNWKPGVNLDWEAWCGPSGKAEWNPEIYARWRRYRKYSTGIIGDLLVHETTPILYALDPGWPTRVTASGSHLIDKKMENHDQVNLTVEFESEHHMIIAGSTCNELGFEKIIRGRKGNLFLNAAPCVFRPESLFVKEEQLEERIENCPDIGDAQDVHRLGWLKCIRSREQPAANVELGTKMMVIVDLATRSMWDGHAYTFDPKTMKSSRV